MVLHVVLNSVGCAREVVQGESRHNLVSHMLFKIYVQLGQVIRAKIFYSGRREREKKKEEKKRVCHSSANYRPLWSNVSIRRDRLSLCKTGPRAISSLSLTGARMFLRAITGATQAAVILLLNGRGSFPNVLSLPGRFSEFRKEGRYIDTWGTTNQPPEESA